MTADLLPLTLVTLQACFVGVALLLLFRLRTVFGLTPLYITVGVFQYLQTALASAVYFELLPGWPVSPGSAILFNASLFSVLLIYIREDAAEARKIIYGLIFANIILSLFTIMLGYHVETLMANQPLNIAEEFLFNTPKVLIIGTITLAIDVFLIIIFYEFISRFIPILVLRIYCTLLLVLFLDTSVFMALAFPEHPDFGSLYRSALLGKLYFALIYSLLFTFYLKYFERQRFSSSRQETEIKDLFTFLTYRQKYELLREEVFRDALTGLYNRGYFNENLPRELQRTKRAGQSMALLMLDIDHFKEVNDNYGHQTGDELLKLLASVLLDTARTMDIVCRFGGEEFCIILPNSDCAAARHFALRVQEKLANESEQHKPEVPCAITVTIGIALAPKETSSPQKLIEIADRRLYSGKQAGRNRVITEG